MERLRNLLTVGALTLAAACGLAAQSIDARAAVDRAQNDLRRAEDFERQKGKEVTGYDNAQKHLSEFDRDFARGHFDQSKLDTAIDDLKNVVEQNTLNPEDRDALGADLATSE
jgi:hypothetical protein